MSPYVYSTLCLFSYPPPPLKGSKLPKWGAIGIQRGAVNGCCCLHLPLKGKFLLPGGEKTLMFTPSLPGGKNKGWEFAHRFFDRFAHGRSFLKSGGRDLLFGIKRGKNCENCQKHTKNMFFKSELLVFLD